MDLCETKDFFIDKNFKRISIKFVDLWICGKLCIVHCNSNFFMSLPQAPQAPQTLLLLQKDRSSL